MNYNDIDYLLQQNKLHPAPEGKSKRKKNIRDAENKYRKTHCKNWLCKLSNEEYAFVEDWRKSMGFTKSDVLRFISGWYDWKYETSTEEEREKSKLLMK